MQVKNRVPFGDKRSGKTRDEIILAAAAAKAKSGQKTTNFLFEEPVANDNGQVTIEASERL